MNFLSCLVMTLAANVDFLDGLEINPFAFIENLQYMGIGMAVIFAIIGIIILATMLVNYLFSE